MRGANAQPDDHAEYQRALTDYPDRTPESESLREQVWTRELENDWPVIREVARLLLSGTTITAEMVESLFVSHVTCPGQNRRHVNQP